MKKYIFLLTISLLVLINSLNACDYTITLLDSYGDGWNGASLDVDINGTTAGNITLDDVADDGYTNTWTITVNSGDVLDFTFYTGSYDSECTWEIYDLDGNLVCTGSPSTTDCDGISVDCNDIPPPPPIYVTGCSGTFSDLGGTGGGASGNYGNNETQTWVFCPNPGWIVSMDFTMWDVVGQFVGDDALVIYDGDDNTAPIIQTGNELNPVMGIVQASSTNATGCLTFEWTSNGTDVGAGWEADINCVQPCQLVQSVWTGTDVGGYIDICQGETVNFSAIGNYPDPQVYVQSDATSTFEWDFGDGTTATGQNVSHTFNTEGGYDINLVITDVNNCTSSNDLGIRVRVSTTPTFVGTAAATDPVCLGSCSSLTGVPNMTLWETPPGQILGGLTPLPDGTGAIYTTSLIFDNFAPGATVTSVNDIVDLCINLEHSYIGDLVVTIECPDGSSTQLFDGNEADDAPQNGSLGQWLGVPIDDDLGNPGTGWEYCFNMTTGTQNITETGGAYQESISAGDYTPSGTWADLIGCPLNGAWTINILDDQGSDDGFIFEWGISFDPTLYPDGWGFTPTVASESWSGTTVTAGNPTTACPPDLGTENYTYTIIDNFGCSYDTTISITAIGIAVDTVSVNPTCNGSCDGSIAISNPSGGSAPYNYTWSANASTGNSAAATGLCAGTYTVTIADGGAGCTNVQTFTLVDPPVLTIAFTTSPEVCGASNGEINVSVTGGANPIDYTWQVTAGTGTTNGTINNQGNPYDITSLQASTYSVTATDASGCFIVGSTVVGGSGTVVGGFTTSANQCLEGNSFDFINTGSVGGTITISYDIQAPSGATTNLPGPDVIGAVANEVGVWTITQTTQDGACIDVTVLTVTVYNEPQLSLVATDLTCNQLNTGSGTNDGTITASVINSNGAETYTIITGTGSFAGTVASGLTANTYDVVIVDLQGCNDTATITLIEPPVITLSLTSTPNLCNGVPCDGTANVAVASGGVGPFSYLWSNTLTSQNITGLCAGTYDVSVYDSNSPANGCYEIGSQIITEPAAEVYTPSSLDATCGLATGSATITVNTSPASATYEYTWFSDAGLTTQIDNTAASASTTNTTVGVAAGTYYVQVENANGCTDVIAVAVVDNGSPTLNITSTTDILCNGASTGQISVDISGTLNPNFTYTWDDGSGAVVGASTASTTDQQTGLSAGTYDITVTDNAGCQSAVNVVLTEPTLMTGSVTIVDANCSTNGSLTVNTANGTGPYTYLWDYPVFPSAPLTSQVISVGTGVYNVTVYDANLCELYLSGTVNDIGGIDADTTINSHVLCFGSNEGSITANPIGGSFPYTYVWTAVGFDDSVLGTYSDLPAGTYNCVVTDANGCGAVTSAVITEPTEVHFIFVDSTMVSCFGGTDGDITVDGIGGTAPYTFDWDLAAANQTTAQATALGVGCYTVTVEDNNHCTTDTTICIHEPTQLVLSVDTYDAHCDQADGSASVNISGGTAPYPPATITWSAGTATALADSITGLAFGSYTVTVIDNNGCQEIANFNIDSIARGIISIATYTDVSCFGGNDGSVQVSIGGGGGSNTYVWAPAGYTDDGLGEYSDLIQGTYNVTATDVWGCELYASQTIIEPAQLTLTINHLDDRCNGTCEGTADAVVGGGTAPYSYQWDDALLSTTSGLTGLCAGWYTLTIGDANGCSVIDSVEILEPVSITLTASIDSSSCGQADGKIVVYPINGVTPFTFNWSPNPTGSVVDSLDGIAQGSYCVTITDSKNCPFDSCFIVVDQNSPTVQIDSIHNPLCYESDNGEAFASSIGGVLPYTWAWSSDSSAVPSISNVATNLDGGNVCVTVTDVNGCQSTACTTLVENPQLIVNYIPVDVLCQSDSTGQASSTVTGGTGLGTYTYLWNGLYAGPSSMNEDILDSIPSGTYSLLVTDINGCQNLTNNIQINEPTHISLLSSNTPVQCNGACDGIGTIIASGGEGTYTYSWPDGQTSAMALALCAGSYTPTVTDGYGCVDSTVISISEPTPFVLDSIVYEHISCYGACNASIVTYVSGGTFTYSFQYDGPSGYSATTQTISSLCLAGNYVIHVEDGNGCPIDTSHIVNQPPELLESYTSLDETCYGYCDGEAHVSVIGGTGIYSVAWSDGLAIDDLDRTGLCPGIYTYTVTDEHLCSVSNTVTILGNPLLDIVESSITDATCNQCDGEATVSLFGGVTPYTIGWFGGDFSSCLPATPYPDGGNALTQTGLPQGIHSIYVEDGNGCRDTVDIVINNLTGPTIVSTPVTDVLCHGDATGTIQVNVTGGTGTITYAWNAGTTGSTLIPNSLNQPTVYAGTYYFSATDVSGCVASTIIEVEENEAVLIAINNINNASCYGLSDGSATIQGFGGTGVGTYTYSWNTIPAQSTVTATGLGIGTYQGIVTDANGCPASDVFSITEPPAITLAAQNVTQTTCASPQLCDGTIQVSASGGPSTAYNYNWFGYGSNQSTTGDLCSGNYQLQITSLTCSEVFSFVVAQPDTIHVFLGQDPIACNDPNGMIWIDSIIGGTTSNYFNTQSDHMDNNPMQGNATDGYWTCAWDVQASTYAYVDGVYNQTYSVQVYDPANTQCSVTQSISVGEVPEPYLFSQNTTSTSCNGMSDGQARIEVKQGTPEFHYNWALGNNIPFPTGADTVLITNLASGTYTLTVVDDNGCEVPTTFIIIEPNPISVTTTLVPNDIICISQSAAVYANGAGGTPSYQYDWDGTGSWTPNSALMLSPISDTLVVVTMRDKLGCEATTQRVIYVHDSLQIEAIADGEICEGESFILDVVYQNGGNGNYSYFWSEGSNLSQTEITPTISQVYYVTLTDNCGTPPIIDSVEVAVNPNPYVQTISRRDSCEPLGMVFIPYPADLTCQYLWSFGDSQSGNNNSTEMYPSHNYQNAGTYSVSLDLISDKGCTYDTIFENWIVVYPLPLADLGMNPNPASLFNNTVTFTDLTVSDDPIEWITWDLSNAENIGPFNYLGGKGVVTYDSPGYYNIGLFAETVNSCKDTIWKVLRVNDEYTLYAPDAFSPGQDGRNDYFYPLGHGLDETKEYLLTIYDRWGIEIFQTNIMPNGTDKQYEDARPELLPEDERGWNGKYQNTGEYVQNDVYTWALKVVDVNGVSHEASGRVTVIR